MLAGLWQAAVALRAPAVQAVSLSSADVREGRSSAAFARALDASLPNRSGLIATANALRYGALGGAGEQVRAGTDGWLYLAEELRFDAEGPAHLNQRVRWLGEASLALQRQGVSLVVLLVPDKVRVHPEHLRQGLPGWEQARYGNARAALRGAGVETIDLMAPFAAARAKSSQPLYYRTDTHWNTAGAEAAAQAIAALLAPRLAAVQRTGFDTRRPELGTRRAGDLLKLMGLADWPQLPAALRPPDDLEREASTRPMAAPLSSGLFDNPVPPVVLTGTSYSLRANFHGFLQQALQTEVLNTARDGAGFVDAAAAYFADEAFATAKPAVLIWELPERFLTLPLSGKERAALAPLLGPAP
jgi:alginate O-acetyltransferase complex protein AlgJ